jgi:hypothetical protein
VNEKEKIMGFEKRVLEVVGKVIGQDETAEFAYGTLFVPSISPKQAAKIETALIETFKCGVIVSPQPNSEFSFDFV